VHLPKTGYVVLTGDLAHFKDNWDNDRVPSMNTSADQTHASHAKVVKVLADKKAQLWINHDKATSAGQKHAPAFYD
jgi:N-acyl homoserine lactone hydrolase